MKHLLIIFSLLAFITPASAYAEGVNDKGLICINQNTKKSVGVYFKKTLLQKNKVTELFTGYLNGPMKQINKEFSYFANLDHIEWNGGEYSGTKKKILFENSLADTSDLFSVYRFKLNRETLQLSVNDEFMYRCRVVNSKREIVNFFKPHFDKHQNKLKNKRNKKDKKKQDMKHLLIIFSLLAFITPAHAQSSKADRAIQCAAIYHIATAFVGGNKQAAKAFTNIQSTFEGVFRANEGQRLKKGITNGYTSKKKAEMAVQLGKKYDKDPKPVYAIEMQCNAWRLKLLPYLKSKIGRTTKDIKNIRSAFLSAPDAPAIPSASNPRWSQSKMMMDKSFTAWNKTGRMTTQKFKQQLKDSLKKSAKKKVATQSEFSVGLIILKCTQDWELTYSSLCDAYQPSPLCLSIKKRILRINPGTATAIIDKKSGIITWDLLAHRVWRGRIGGPVGKVLYQDNKLFKIMSDNDVSLSASIVGKKHILSWYLDKKTMQVGTNQISGGISHRSNRLDVPPIYRCTRPIE